MSLSIQIDSNGFQHIDFYTLREELLAKGGTFTAARLRQVPYDQLIFCATAEAGATRVPLEAVVAEKRSRRHRFVAMEDKALPAATRYLHCQGMFDDVHREVGMLSAPEFASLTEMSKAWLVLNCVHNHIGNPEARLDAAILHLRRAQVESEMSAYLSDLFAKAIHDAIDTLPITSDAGLRRFLITTTTHLMEYMGPGDKSVCNANAVRGYSCASDCYRNKIGPLNV